MLRLVVGLASLLALVSAGCSAVVAPDPSRFDAVDAGPVVMLMDSGPTPGVDSGPAPLADGGTTPVDGGPSPVDGGPTPVDAPPGCVATSPRCEGDVRVICADGVEVRQDCALAGDYCDAGECRDRVCTPGSTECSADLRSTLTCDARGSGWTETPCAFTCNSATGTCLLDPGPTCPGLPTVAVGETKRFSLCDDADGDTYTPTSPGCPANSRADAGDRTFALTITTRGYYVIDLRDYDSTRSIDTVVYLRSACDDASTQLACSDDVPCDASDVPIGSCTDGVQVRQSRIGMMLDPGTYYVVTDAFLYETGGATYQCGQVELRIRQP